MQRNQQSGMKIQMQSNSKGNIQVESLGPEITTNIDLVLIDC